MGFVVQLSICCGFVVDLLYNILCNTFTTNRTSGVCGNFIVPMLLSISLFKPWSHGRYDCNACFTNVDDLLLTYVRLC